MSYCRWSSNNFKCDVYCYESVHGCFTIHVASNRIVDELPPEPFNFIDLPKEEFSKKCKEHHDALDKAKHKKIGLKYDGQSFDCNTIEDMRNTLVELKQVGYIVPDFVFEIIDEEINGIEAF